MGRRSGKVAGGQLREVRVRMCSKVDLQTENKVLGVSHGNYVAFDFLIEKDRSWQLAQSPEVR